MYYILCINVVLYFFVILSHKLFIDHLLLYVSVGGRHTSTHECLCVCLLDILFFIIEINLSYSYSYSYILQKLSFDLDYYW